MNNVEISIAEWSLLRTAAFSFLILDRRCFCTDSERCFSHRVYDVLVVGDDTMLPYEPKKQEERV